MNYKVSVFGAKDTTVSFVEYLLAKGHQIDCLITVDPQSVNTADISGFSSMRDTASSNGITLFEAKNYSLRDEASCEFFTNNTFDIAVCLGWQRLIPLTVLQQFRYGVFGFHGSCGYLPYGRGRSPLNWSIILGDSRFILNMFQYDEHADSPNIYQNRMFEITPYDTIRTLQMKNLLCSYEMTEQLLCDYKRDNIVIKRDTKDFDSVYLKRTPNDGKIDFHCKTREIYNLIRGVTHPFPGAFCKVSSDGCEVRIWDAVPFDNILDFSKYAPGEVVAIFDKMPIIRTVDGSLLLRSYDCEKSLCQGDVLV